MAKIPKKFKKYFWDINFEKLDADEYPTYTIERLLEYGDKDAITWLRGHYSPEVITRVIRNSRNISLRSTNFWALIYDIPKDQIKCLNKELIKEQKAIWPY